MIYKHHMIIVAATMGWKDWAACVHSWNQRASTYHQIIPVYGMHVVEAYEYGRTRPYSCRILGFLHDDLVIEEHGWDKRVVRQFDDPGVGLVGFGGALGHGTHDLYTAPYHLPNLARQTFMSNMRTAETHGARFIGERDVAVLDGFALFVRPEILDRAGGWPVGSPIGFYMYSEWLCCEVRRQGFRIRLVGVKCDHIGGRTSTVAAVQDSYEMAHQFFYDTNRDVMPYRVPE